MKYLMIALLFMSSGLSAKRDLVKEVREKETEYIGTWTSLVSNTSFTFNEDHTCVFKIDKSDPFDEDVKLEIVEGNWYMHKLLSWIVVIDKDKTATAYWFGLVNEDCKITGKEYGCLVGLFYCGETWGVKQPCDDSITGDTLFRREGSSRDVDEIATKMLIEDGTIK